MVGGILWIWTYSNGGLRSVLINGLRSLITAVR